MLEIYFVSCWTDPCVPSTDCAWFYFQDVLRFQMRLVKGKRINLWSSRRLELFEITEQIKVPGENVFLTSYPNLFYRLFSKSWHEDKVLAGMWLVLCADLLLSWRKICYSGWLLFSGKLGVAANKCVSCLIYVCSISFFDSVSSLPKQKGILWNSGYVDSCIPLLENPPPPDFMAREISQI